MPSMTVSNNWNSSGSVISGDQFGGAVTAERKEKYHWYQKSLEI
jgi:hypothetical protein